MGLPTSQAQAALNMSVHRNVSWGSSFLGFRPQVVLGRPSLKGGSHSCSVQYLGKNLLHLSNIFLPVSFTKDRQVEKKTSRISCLISRKKKTFNMLRRATHANPLYPMTKLLSRLPNTQVAIYTGDTKKMQAGDTA